MGYDSNIDYELLTALRPDLVLVYGIAASSGMETKLLELNIPYLYMGEYIEQSPLGKAEWLVALAATRAKARSVLSRSGTRR